ncbi:MAG TPA: hypothetical protein VI248_19110 [Kineosporiaceae bacterium]
MVFLVIAATAPMAAIAGHAPLTPVRDNGISLPVHVRLDALVGDLTRFGLPTPITTPSGATRS